MGLKSSVDKNGNKTLGLVQVANLILATIYQESTFDPDLVAGPNKDGSYDYGLMQINVKGDKDTIKNSNIMLARYNIFAGVGMMFRKVYISPWKSASGIALSQENWMWANYHYQGAGLGRKNVWINMRKLSDEQDWIKFWNEETAKG
jgi:hypothetical protein